MSSKLYIEIEKAKLIRMMKANLKLIALERGGVNNWCNYSDSLNNYLRTQGYEDFDSLAENILNGKCFCQVWPK